MFFTHVIKYAILLVVGTVASPPGKGELPMYVTYDYLIQFGLFIIALIGLCIKISRKDKR